MIRPLDPNRLALHARLDQLRFKSNSYEILADKLTTRRAEELVTEMAELLVEISTLVGKVEWAPEPSND